MMGVVVEFTRGKPKPSTNLVDTILASTIQDWKRATRENLLNELLVSTLPKSISKLRRGTCITDLSSISSIESRLGLTVSSASPGVNGRHGWTATLHLIEDGGLQRTVVSPDIMNSECEARAFLIIFYVRFVLLQKSAH